MKRTLKWALIAFVGLVSAFILLSLVSFLLFGVGYGEPGGVTDVVDP